MFVFSQHVKFNVRKFLQFISLYLSFLFSLPLFTKQISIHPKFLYIGHKIIENAKNKICYQNIFNINILPESVNVANKMLLM